MGPPTVTGRGSFTGQDPSSRAAASGSSDSARRKFALIPPQLRSFDGTCEHDAIESRPVVVLVDRDAINESTTRRDGEANPGVEGDRDLVARTRDALHRDSPASASLRHPRPRCWCQRSAAGTAAAATPPAAGRPPIPRARPTRSQPQRCPAGGPLRLAAGSSGSMQARPSRSSLAPGMTKPRRPRSGRHVDGQVVGGGGRGAGEDVEPRFVASDDVVEAMHGPSRAGEDVT